MVSTAGSILSSMSDGWMQHTMMCERFWMPRRDLKWMDDDRVGTSIRSWRRAGAIRAYRDDGVDPNRDDDENADGDNGE